MLLQPGTTLGPYSPTAKIGEGAIEVADRLRRHRCQVLVLVICVLSPWTVAAQTADLPPIGTVDFYGLQTISEGQVRPLLPWSEGDALPMEVPDSLASDMADALGVARVAFNMGCCDEAGTGWVYVGIEETSSPRVEYRAAPTESTVLVPEVLTSYRALADAGLEAATRGELTEDGSAGHALADYPPARAIQEKFLIYVEQHGETLRQVLYTSADAEHRAAAAMVLGYAQDKARIVPDLERAVLDPDADVRNNAARALWVIAQYADRQPELEITIRADPFIDMLNSVVFTDRNKGLAMVWSLTASREPTLLGDLRERALPSLIEMCRWKNAGHAYPACRILERMLGLPEQDELHPKETTLTKAMALLSPDTALRR